MVTFQSKIGIMIKINDIEYPLINTVGKLVEFFGLYDKNPLLHIIPNSITMEMKEGKKYPLLRERITSILPILNELTIQLLKDYSKLSYTFITQGSFLDGEIANILERKKKFTYSQKELKEYNLVRCQECRKIVLKSQNINTICRSCFSFEQPLPKSKGFLSM